MRCALLLACSVAGCAGVPAVDPAAPVVLTDIATPLTCPQPVLPVPPAELVAPVALDTPALLPAGQGDYGLTRAGVEQIIDALRTLRERLAQWEAWAP